MFKFVQRLSKPFGSLRGVHSSSTNTTFAEPKAPDNAKCINKIILMGRCVGESQTRPLNNSSVTSFIMATNEIRKTKSNELIRRSDFHKVFVYQPFLAEKAFKLITKGTRVYMEGKLNYRKRDDIYFTNIIAEKLIFISGTAQDADADSETVDYEEADEGFINEAEAFEKTDSKAA